MKLYKLFINIKVILVMVYYICFYILKKVIHNNSAITISKFNNEKITRQSLDKRSSLIKLNHLNKINNQYYNTFLSNFESEFNITDGISINVYDDKEDKGYKKVLLLSLVDSKNCPQELHINKNTGICLSLILFFIFFIFIKVNIFLF